MDVYTSKGSLLGVGRRIFWEQNKIVQPEISLRQSRHGEVRVKTEWNGEANINNNINDDATNPKKFGARACSRPNGGPITARSSLLCVEGGDSVEHGTLPLTSAPGPCSLVHCASLFSLFFGSRDEKSKKNCRLRPPRQHSISTKRRIPRLSSL
eukprot:scaffold2182_cov198-Amphora_coffeaeformis.AAC.12